ncbi:hypothetical protein BCR33DRAFT_711571 [Rhizoclosmatium globosum]|uniref:Uncharacterized protein n=1 Tax=Rhizoclosmatium globosum TaxID=329046 RepID=A0A1Y2D1S9_9FUNG|nr:hypothetical protein BCR33DRAFT_711571 [Rhizoclosmatium globosum]|eukprot:ORY53239.1 hypothetical protein BCR33DRAFT_711571 [Rhizoclosmatium globosum]
MPWQRASEPLDDEQFVYQTTHSLGQSVDAPDTTRVPLAQRLPSVQTTLVDSKKTPRLRNQYLSDASSPSSQVSSLALGADYSGFKKKKKHAALPHLPVNNNPNLLNTPTSASFQDYYQRPILQKRLRSSASSSVASSERSYNAMIPPTVTAHVHHPQHLSRSGMIGVGNNPGGYFTSSSSSASTAASYNNLNTHNYTNTRRGLPPLVINERTRLLPSSSSSASSSASTAANRNLEIDAGGRVTVSVSVAASTKIYAFEFELMAINWGLLWDVVLNGADLEVFVEASGDTIAAPSLPPISHAPFPIHTTSQELLATFPPLNSSYIPTTQRHTLRPCRIVIEDPSSTVGKIIYMNYPYKLVMKGSVHIVEARDEIISRECGPTYL